MNLLTHNRFLCTIACNTGHPGHVKMCFAMACFFVPPHRVLGSLLSPVFERCRVTTLPHVRCTVTYVFSVHVGCPTI